MNELVRPDPARRLGVGAVRAHAFFSGFDWGLLGARAMRPPLAIKLLHSLDTRMFEEYDEEAAGILRGGPAAGQEQGAGGAGQPGSGASLLVGGRPWDDAF